MSSQPSFEDLPPLESSDPLDRLLLRAPLASPDPWFTARTVARCRYSQAPAKSSLGWLRFGPRWAIGGVFALFLFGFTVQQLHHSHKIHSHKQRSVQEAFEIMASLGSDADATTSAGQDSSF